MNWTLAGFIAFLLAVIAYVVYNIRKGALDAAAIEAERARARELEKQALEKAKREAEEDKTIADKIIQSGSGADAGQFLRDSFGISKESN